MADSITGQLTGPVCFWWLKVLIEISRQMPSLLTLTANCWYYSILFTVIILLQHNSNPDLF